MSTDDKINTTSIATVLRPYRRFEFDYDRNISAAPVIPAQKASGAFPIVFTAPSNPNDVNPTLGQQDLFAIDEQARVATPGYSPRLGAMVSVPFGASICFYLPVVPARPLPDSLYEIAYAWRPVWRMRNMGDYRRKGKPWKIGKEAYGAPDTNPVDGGPRVIIPAGTESSIYVRTEPYITNVHEWYGTQYAQSETIVIPAVNKVDSLSPLSGGVIPQMPLLPQASTTNINTQCVVQQGTIDSQVVGLGTDDVIPAAPPLFIPYWTKCQGDEVALWCYKVMYKSRNEDPQLVFLDWDFGYNCDPASPSYLFSTTNSEDEAFSICFGVGSSRGHGPYPEMGPYIVYGQTGV